MNKLSLFSLLMMFIVIGACSGNHSAKNEAGVETKTAVPDMHTAENALDYPGVYMGTIPAASGPGIKITLTLNKDKSFEMVSDYIDEKDAVFTEKGEYVIDGNIITLNAKNEAPRYLKVEEGQVRMLDADRQVVTGALANDYILKQTRVF